MAALLQETPGWPNSRAGALGSKFEECWNENENFASRYSSLVNYALHTRMQCVRKSL